MKNDTKIKVRLSRQLFESLTKQVLAEAKGKKNLGAGMEEVKKPKAKKERVEEAEKPTGGMGRQQLGQSLIDLGIKLKKDTESKIGGSEGSKLDALIKQLLAIAGEEDSATAALDRVAKTATAATPKTAGKNLPAPPSTGLEEDEMSLVNPVSWPTQFKDVTEYFGALLGSGMIGAVFYGIMNDLNKGKISRKQAATKLADELQKTAAKATDEPAPKG